MTRSGRLPDLVLFFEFGGVLEPGVLCHRVRLYQAIYLTIARRAMARVGPGRHVATSHLRRRHAAGHGGWSGRPRGIRSRGNREEEEEESGGNDGVADHRGPEGAQ